METNKQDQPNYINRHNFSQIELNKIICDYLDFMGYTSIKETFESEVHFDENNTNFISKQYSDKEKLLMDIMNYDSKKSIEIVKSLYPKFNEE